MSLPKHIADKRDELMIEYVRNPADSFLVEPTISYAFISGFDAGYQAAQDEVNKCRDEWKFWNNYAIELEKKLSKFIGEP